MQTKEFHPRLEVTGQVTAFVENALLAENCPAPVVAKVLIAVDELFSNIARYSGASRARISCEICDDEVVLCLIDNGMPFDPTGVGPPDTDSPLPERNVGGLGIHMVRSIMDDMEYIRIDGWNTLTARKAI